MTRCPCGATTPAITRERFVNTISQIPEIRTCSRKKRQDGIRSHGRGRVRNIEPAMDDRPDPRQQLLETMRQRSEENAAEVAAFDEGCLRVARHCIHLWHQLWRDDAVSFDSSLEIKSRVCFPLAAHALNHADTALGLHQERPWVAASCTRVAFEHALAAQWVLLTEDGEQELVNYMKGEQYKRGREFAEALGRLAFDPAMSGLALDDSQLQALVGDRPDSSGWSVANACSRFSDTKLFYDIYRNLSQSEHPSPGLIAAHLAATPVAGQHNISVVGALHPSEEVPRALALSALWSLYVLELMREGQPYAATVAQIGREASLPTDLRDSDQHPDRQPGWLARRDK